MMLRSPPPTKRRSSVQPPPAPPATQNRPTPSQPSNGAHPASVPPPPTSRNLTQLSSSTSHLSNSLRHSPPGSSSRRPENAQNEYWVNQVASYVAKLNDANLRVAAAEEAKTKAIQDLQTKFAAEKLEWQDLCDMVGPLYVQRWDIPRFPLFDAMDAPLLI